MLNTKNYYLPQNRSRIYILGLNLEKVKLRNADLEHWGNDFDILKHGTDVKHNLTVLNCMYQSTSKYVQSEFDRKVTEYLKRDD